MRAKLAKRHASESSRDDTSAQNHNIAPQHEGGNQKRKRSDSDTDDLPGLPEAIPEIETAKKSKISKSAKKKAKMKRRAGACKKCDMGVNEV